MRCVSRGAKGQTGQMVARARDALDPAGSAVHTAYTSAFTMIPFMPLIDAPSSTCVARSASEDVSSKSHHFRPYHVPARRNGSASRPKRKERPPDLNLPIPAVRGRAVLRLHAQHHLIRRSKAQRDWSIAADCATPFGARFAR